MDQNLIKKSRAEIIPDSRNAKDVSLINSLLNDDMLSKIFLKIDSEERHTFGLVCKRWLRIEGILCSSLRVIKKSDIFRLSHRFPLLKCIDFSKCAQITDSDINLLSLAYGSSLQSLNLSGNKFITCEGFKSIGQNCIRLIELIFVFGSFSDSALLSLANCHSLQVLNLTNCRAITDGGLCCLSVGCKSLTRVILKWCMEISDLGIQFITYVCKSLTTLDLSYTKVSSQSMASISSLPSLHHLLLVGCHFINDESLTILQRGCSSLKILDLTWCENISHFGLQSLNHSTMALHQLSLSFCTDLTRGDLCGLTFLSQLRCLKLDSCLINNDSLNSIGLHCSFLEEISLRRCKHIGDEGLMAVISKNHSLHTLDIACVANATDAVLFSLSDFCKNLHVLRVEGCPLMTSEGFSTLLNSCLQLKEIDFTECAIKDAGLLQFSKLKVLKKLKLGFCLDISDHGFLGITLNCSFLEEIDLYRCSRLTDSSLVQLSHGCPRLKNLNISYCELISDVGLKALAHCTYLLVLELRSCNKVTFAGLDHLVRGCHRLAELDLKRCTSLDDSALISIARHASRLQQINLSFTLITGVGLEAITSLPQLQNLKLVVCRNVTLGDLQTTLPKIQCLRKLKLDAKYREFLALHVIDELEGRGCKLRWMSKSME